MDAVPTPKNLGLADRSRSGWTCWPLDVSNGLRMNDDEGVNHVGRVQVRVGRRVVG